MRRIFEIVNKAFVRKILLFAALLAAVVLAGCAEANTEDEGVNENGFKIKQTTTSADGAAMISCTGNKQSISLIFNVADDYVISTDGCEWITILSGATGEGGTSRSVKFSITDNISDNTREATISITIGDAEPCTFAVVKQSAKVIDAVTKWIDERLSTEYYWLDKYNELRAAGKIDFSKSEAAFLKDALTGKKWNNVNKDDGYLIPGTNDWHLFSYIQELTSSRAEPSDMVSGFGVALCYTVVSFSNIQRHGFIIEHTYPSSPAYNAGLRRGDIILKVNGQYINQSNYNTLFNTIQTSIGSTLTLSKIIPDSEGETKDYPLGKGDYYESPIAYCGLLTENVEYGFDFEGRKIGYISYLSFDNTYDEELINAVKRLRDAGVTDLIVDLRANGGGAVISSVRFASMLLPASYAGEEMVTLVRNKKNTSGNSVFTFASSAQIAENEIVELPHIDNLQKIYFITSEDTASSSELLIMSLRAQGIEAITVGTQSLGKDCGMDVITKYVGAKRYEFAPITFMNKFPNYDVNFSEGIPADIDFDKLKKEVKDKDLIDKLGWYPLPDMGATWGNYMYDIALAEAVANILGKTIFHSEEPQSQHISLPHLQTTRSQGHHSKALKVSKPAVRGMYLTQEHRVILEQQTEKKN